METIKIVEQEAVVSEAKSVKVPVIEITAEPVVTTYTEEQVDQQIKFATMRLASMQKGIEVAQEELDKWTNYKAQF